MQILVTVTLDTKAPFKGFFDNVDWENQHGVGRTITFGFYVLGATFAISQGPVSLPASQLRPTNKQS